MKLTPFLIAIGLVCAAPSAQARPDDPLHGWIGQVCYSNGTGRTVIDYASFNGCAVRLNEAIADPPFGTTVTSVTSCSLRGTGIGLPWCAKGELLGIEIDGGDVRPLREFQRQLDDLRRRHGIDDYERKLLELQRTR